MAVSRRAIFIDKDGTLIENVPYNADPAGIKLTLRAGPALKRLQDFGFALIVITNQPGIARGLLDEEAMPRTYTHLNTLLKPYGVVLTGFHYCPHAENAGCACRKPQPGMLRAAASQHGIALNASWMIGDILDDVEAGMRAGCRTVLIDNGNETEWIMSPMRNPDIQVPDLYAAATKIAAFEKTGSKKENQRHAAH